MDAYQMKRVSMENAKQKNSLITGNDFVTVPQLGYYSKEEFHQTVQGWVSEGFSIVKVTDVNTIYYMQTQHIPDFYKKSSQYITIEVVKSLPLYEPVFRFSHEFAYSQAMEQA